MGGKWWRSIYRGRRDTRSQRLYKGEGRGEKVAGSGVAMRKQELCRWL